MPLSAQTKAGAAALAGALEATCLPIVCVHANGTVHEWTCAAAEMTGMPSAQVVGQPLESCIRQDDHKALKEMMSLAMKGAETSSVQVRVDAPGGGSQAMLLGLSPWRGENGGLLGMVGVFEDPSLTSWNMGAHADLLSTANAPVFAADLRGNVTEWNQNAAEVCGVGRDDITGKRLADQFPVAAHLVQEALAAAAEGKRYGPFEAQPRSGALPLALGASPQLNSHGKPIGALFVGQVVCGGAKAPAAYSADKPTSSNGDLKRVKGMVMHEMRSPLHGIIGLANTLSSDEGSHQRPLKMIGASAARVLELITNLMDYLNLAEDDTENLVTGPVDMPQVLEEAVVRCENLKDKKGKPLMKDAVKFTKDISPDAPRIMADGQLITQMLYHLVSNAFKFTAAGYVTILVRRSDGEDGVSLTVEDSGIGISKDCLDKVLEPFQQEDSSENRKYDGIGLGLAIVREVLRLHGGSIEMFSTQGKGSSFTITLPCELPNCGGGPPQLAADQACGKEFAGAKAAVTPPRAKPCSWLGPAALVGPPPLPVKWKSRPESAQQPQQAQPSQPAPSQRPPSSDAAAAPAQGNTVDLPPKMPDASKEKTVIMSVDDDHINQEVMRSVLEPFGFEIVVCMSGYECFDYMNEPDSTLPDLILLDLMMPGIDGFSVLREQRKTYAAEIMPIIMVSAKNQASSVVKGLELGCNDWIHKPFDRQELIARVKTHLKLKETYTNAIRSQVGGPAPVAPAAPPPVMQPQAPALIEHAIDTCALFVFLLAEGDPSPVFGPSFFERLEALSHKYKASHTEIIGSCYLAVATSTGDTAHIDRFFVLALHILDAFTQIQAEAPHFKFKFGVGLHSDSHTPKLIATHSNPRQYPATCYFSDTTREAKELGEKLPLGCILCSSSLRTRLSADSENEVQVRNLKLVPVAGPANGSATDCFAVVSVNAPNVIVAEPAQPPAAPPAAPPAEAGPSTDLLKQELFKTQEDLKCMRQQLDLANQKVITLQAASQSSTMVDLGAPRAPSLNPPSTFDVGTLGSSSFGKLSTADIGPLDSASIGKLPSSMLGGSMPDVSSYMPSFPSYSIPPAPSMNMSIANGAATGAGGAPAFLQWQVLRLQAEVRFMEKALSNVHSELQIQTANAMMLEKSNSRLQEQVAHLELDAGFKKAWRGNQASGPQGSPFHTELPRFDSSLWMGGATAAAVGMPTGSGLTPRAEAGNTLMAGLSGLASAGVPSGNTLMAGLSGLASAGVPAGLSMTYMNLSGPSRLMSPLTGSQVPTFPGLAEK